MGKDALGAITVTVAVNCHVLKGHKVKVNLLVVLVRLVVHDCELAEIFGLFLACKDKKQSKTIKKARSLIKRGSS